MKYWIYIHTCPNGKKYVGVTTARKPEYRWRRGNGYYYNLHFYNAILKYGWDNITHEIFEVESKEEMYRKEVELISFYHSNDPEYGYNHSSGGEISNIGCRSKFKGIPRTEEVKQKISEAKKGKKRGPLSEQWKKNISKAKKGKPNPHVGTPRPHLRKIHQK